ncbi:MAG: MauE/DoxX family redox-associated membrane protein [Pseudomonadota bacterium]
MGGLPVLLDPILPLMAASALAIVLLTGAWQKLRDREAFALAIEQYRLLPESWAGPAALALAGWELVAGGLLLAGTTRPWGGLAAAALLLLVTAAVALNLLRGRAHIDCGCGGPEGGQHLSWSLVARNLALMALAAATRAPEAARELEWLDGLTAGAGALGLYGLYAAANQLLANRPRLMKLRG